MAIGWLLFAAPETLAYLQPFAHGTIQSFRSLFSGHSSAPPTSAGPLINRLLAATGAFIVSALLPVGWWQIWRRHRRQPWTVAIALVSASWYVIVASGLRSQTAASWPGGQQPSPLYQPPMSLRWRWSPCQQCYALATAHVSAAVLVVVLFLLSDGLVNGWPPYPERLPGPHQVARRTIGWARGDRNGSVDVGSARAGEPVCD